MHLLEPVRTKTRKIALLLSSVAVAVVIVGAATYQHVRERALERGVNQVSLANLALARSMVLATRESGRSIAELLESVPLPIQGTILCVIGPDGRLEYHSRFAERIGADVSGVGVGMGTTADLLATNSDWHGTNVSFAQVTQVAAYAYWPEHRGLVSVHTPMAVVRAATLSDLQPFLYGTVASTLLALLALAGMYALWLRALRDFEREQQVAETMGADLIRAQKLETVAKLATGVAHDINNVVTVIRGHSDLLSRTAAEVDRADHIAPIVTATKVTEHLANRLMLLGRDQPIQREPADVAALVRSFEQDWSALLGSGLVLDVDVEGDDLTVYIDPLQFQQVLLNLVVNARDAMGGRGQVTISAQLQDQAPDGISAHRIDGRCVRVCVADHGPGMPASVTDGLFATPNTTKRTRSTSGIGLMAVAGIVRRSGGGLVVDSSPDGTNVAIYLPIYDAGHHIPVVRAVHDGDAPLALIVEDDPAVSDLIVATLTEHGWQCVHTEHVATACHYLDASDARGFSLVIAEIALGTGSGLEIANRHRDRTSLRIVLTSDAPPPDEYLSMFLQKPFEITALLAKVAEQNVLETASRDLSA